MTLLFLFCVEDLSIVQKNIPHHHILYIDGYNNEFREMNYKKKKCIRPKAGCSKT